MAFNINAQVVLSGPKNLNKISKQIQQGIGKSGAIKVAVDPRSLRNIRSLNTTVSNLNNNISSLNKSATTLRSTLSSVNNGLSKANSSSSAFNKNQQQTASSVNNVNKALQQQSATLGTLGKRFLSTAKTAIAFGLISRPIYDLQRAFVGATKDAVQFQREIVKISQVTGTSVQNLTGLTNEINKLATTLGVSANELAETSRIIAQTGRSAAEIQPILNALARSTLAPTFGKITDTTEGLIAALGQFQLEAGQSEVILGSLNKVSKSFAVEAEDLISVIRRTGGVFAQAAGDSRNTVQALQELAAIFTAVRSTTRESADTIAAGLRTIFSRIQRRGTIEFLEQFGVQLTNVKGEFIGIFPAFDELSNKLSTLIKQGDALTLSAIAEELGGIRQIGKLLPAIAQFDKARAALEQAQKGAVEGLGVDVAKGLDTVDNRIRRVKESFDELIRTVFESDSFQNFTRGVLSSAETILQFGTKVVEALEPILPLLQGIGAVKLGQALGGFVGGGGVGRVAGGLSGQAAAQASQAAAKATQSNTQILTTINTTLQRSSNQLSNIFQSLEGNFRTLTTQMSNLIQAIGSFSSAARASSVAGFAGGVRRRSGGGKIFGFNRGGVVPGTGNRDTVPAMLTPGEFVIKKSSVESIGAGQLASMNKYANGGKVSDKFGAIALLPIGDVESRQGIVNVGTGKRGESSLSSYLLRQAGGKKVFDRFPQTRTLGAIRQAVGIGPSAKQLKTNVVGESFSDQDLDRQIGKDVEAAFTKLISNTANNLGKKIGAKSSTTVPRGVLKSVGTASTIGSVFEGSLSLLGAPFDRGSRSDEQDPFDFPSGIGSTLSSAFPSLAGLPVEAKRDLTNELMIDIANRKATNFIGNQIYNSSAWQSLILEATRGPRRTGRGSEGALRRLRRASGGSISGQDTVPALLTPGEFVFNKESAGRIGYSTLNAMNKKGIQGFNKGGAVGVQRFLNGGLVDPRGPNVNALLEDIKTDNKNGSNSGDSKKAGAALGDLAGVALSASFAVQSLTSSFEDGKFTVDELFNSALLLAPVIPAISSSMESLKPSFEKFKTELRNTRGALGKARKVFSGTGGRIAAGAGALAGASLTTVEGDGPGAVGARAAGSGLTAGFGSALLGVPAPIAALIGVTTALTSVFDDFIKSSSPLPNALEELSNSSKKASENLDKISPQGATELSADVFEDVGKVISARIEDSKVGSTLSALGSGASAIGGGLMSSNEDTRGLTQGMLADGAFAIAENIVTLGGLLTGEFGKPADRLIAAFDARKEASPDATSEFMGAALGDPSELFEDIDQLAAPGIEALKKSLSQIDASPANSIDEFRNVLDGAGASADQANDILTNVSKTGLNNLTDRLSDFKDETSGVQNRINGLLDQLAKSKSVEDFNSKLKELDNVIQSTGEESLKDFSAESIVTGAALDTLNSTLNTSEKTIVSVDSALNKFNQNINSVADQLSFSLKKISTETDNFQKRVNAIFAGTGQITIGRSVSGLSDGAGKADKRASFARFNAAATGDVSGLETIVGNIQDLPNIGEQFLRGSQANTTSPKKFAENFGAFFQSRAGAAVEIPDTLINSIEKAIIGQGNREGNTPIVPREAFKNILEGDDGLSDQIEKLGGGVAKSLNDVAKRIDEASNPVAEALEKEVNFRLQILAKQRQVEEKLISQQENRASRLSTLRGETVDPLSQATSSQAGQLSRLGFAGGDVSSISAARDKALKEQEAATKDASAAQKTSKDKLLELADEVARSTEALKILGDQSKSLAAIEAKSAALKRQEQLEGDASRQVIAAAQQGDPRALLELNRQIQNLRLVQSGGGNAQQRSIALEFSKTSVGQSQLGGEEQQQDFQARIERELAQNVAQFSNQMGLDALGSFIKQSTQRGDDARLGQRGEAERFRAVAAQEQAAGRASADINNAAIAAAESRAATEDPSQVFSNAVDSFAKAVGVFIAPPAPPAPPLPGSIPTPSAPAIEGPSGFLEAARKKPRLFGAASGIASGVITSMFQRGPTPAPPSQLDQIRNANRSRFEQQQEARRTGFRRRQLERREAVGTLDDEQRGELNRMRTPAQEIKQGSEEGANLFSQAFNSFAEKLPEQINAVLEPIQILGTDSIGEAIGQQLLPQIQKMLQSMIDPDEGLENPAAGAGIN